MIYLANTTKQNWIHCFRAPETGRAQMVNIPSGKQMEIGHNWNADQDQSVVDHLEKFGARPATDASGKLDKFPGLLYRVGKPVSETQIVDGHDAVVDGQEKRSIAETVRSAKGFDIANRARGGRGARLAKVTEVEVQQDIPRNQKPSGEEVRFKLSVSEDGGSDKNLPG